MTNVNKLAEDKFHCQRVFAYLEESRKKQRHSLNERGNFIKRNRDKLEDHPARSLVAHHDMHDSVMISSFHKRNQTYEGHQSTFNIRDKLKDSFK